MDINNETMLDLHRMVHGAFRGALASAPVAEWQKVATRIGSSSTSNLYPFLAETGGMREWVGDAIFDQLRSYRYEIVNRKFQKGLWADRDQILDDAGGLAPLLSSHAEIAARACASHPDEIVIGEALNNAHTLLCYDGQPMVDDSHPNANGDGGTQDNDMDGSGTAWYLMDTTRPLKPLIYQVREAIQFASLTNMNSDSVFHTHKFKWNAWTRDAAGYGLWQTLVKSRQTLNEANFVEARQRMASFHIGEKDPLTGTYRPMRCRANLLVVPQSLEETARKLFGQDRLASGEDNYLKGAIEIFVSKYLD